MVTCESFPVRRLSTEIKEMFESPLSAVYVSSREWVFFSRRERNHW